MASVPTTPTSATPRPSVWNLPNQLTASRFVLALILFGFIQGQIWLACLATFALAALTDWLDGYFARKQGLSSTLGRNLDPLVDKVLICGAYTFLIPEEAAEITPWMVTIVVARELVITSLRSFIENLGGNFGADWMGKVKMGLQCAALIAIFIALEAKADGLIPAVHHDWLLWVQRLLVWAMLAATLLSGLQYLWKAASVLRIESIPDR